MIRTEFPYVHLPEEFVALLKSNSNLFASGTGVFDVLKPNKALMKVLEAGLTDPQDRRNPERAYLTQGWLNFRDRLGATYVYKSVYGSFPQRPDIALVEDIRQLELVWADHAIQSLSRIFLLGFYMKLAQAQLQERENNRFLEFKVPVEAISPVLKLTQGRSEKIDWVILLVWHLLSSLGEKQVMSSIIAGQGFNELFDRMPDADKLQTHSNLLAYSASIQEPDMFLYEKV